MTKGILFAAAVWLAVQAPAASAQTIHSAPRPPAQTGISATESATPDGYAPIPAWLGQTRAPRPAKTAEYTVETVAQGLNGAFSFNFLPDGRMIVAERPGHIRLVAKDGKVSEVLGLPSNLWAQGQGLFEVRPDRAFATNRTLYLTYTVLPDDANRQALPRSPGVLVVARARLSADDSHIEDIKILLKF